MASMVDRGDNYHVLYLGCSMLAQASTGLGVLQRPLKDLYFRYRQPGGGPGAQERYLQMSPRGLVMTFKETASARPTEVFYDMPSILFWDAVQFVAVRGSKKTMCAFEPLDNDHSRNKDNLFQLLDKRYHYLQQMTHAPMFTCVLRRTAGVKALDLHAFVCASDEEALGLVRALNGAQRNYAADEVNETGVFGYRPWSAEAAGRSPDAARNLRPVSRVQSVRQLPPDGPGRVAAGQAPGGTPSYQLTQDDLLSGSRQDLATEAATRSPEHVYQYLGHIEESLPRSAARSPEKRVNAKSVFPGGVADRVAQQAKTKGLGQQEDVRTSPDGRSSLPRSEPSRTPVAKAVVRPVGLPVHPSPREDSHLPAGPRGSKLGQGYSLLSGPGAPLPLLDDRDSSDDEGWAPGSPPSLPPRHRSGSPSYVSSLPRDGAIPRPVLLPHYRDYEPRRDSWERRQGPPRPLPREDLHAQRYPSREDIRQSPTESYQDRFPPRREPEGRQFNPPGRASEPMPSRPVAKVPPHKVTGVKVLPIGPFPSLKPATDTTSGTGDRPRSTVYYDDTMYSSKLPKTYPDNCRRGKASSPSSESPYSTNWQFKPPNEEEYGYQSNRKQEQTEDKSDPMSEKLLMNQKKDAEIASLMHGLQFQFDGKTMSPGMPAGNNFEKSLGYFP